MTTLEELGLLKMDFLGLRTLTVIRDTLGFIEESGKAAPDLDRLPFTDDKVRITSYNVCYTKLLRSILTPRPRMSASGLKRTR